MGRFVTHIGGHKNHLVAEAFGKPGFLACAYKYRITGVNKRFGDAQTNPAIAAGDDNCLFAHGAGRENPVLENVETPAA
jgi:hypothetical protein